MSPLVAERRKKTKVGDKGKEAAAKKPRSRKARVEGPGSEVVSAPAEDRPEEQARTDTLKSPNPASGGPRAPLPGELYRRQDQWWWRVQLPGEDKATARTLKTNGEETPADGQEAAQKIALALWEHAIEEDATRRLRLESTEKIERLKAQFLDKVRHFTELVETANAKVEAEQRARAEVEAKLAQMLQAAGPRTGRTPALGGHPEQVGPSPSGVIPFDRQPGTSVPPMEQAEPEMPTPVPHPPIAPTPAHIVAQSGLSGVVTHIVAPLPPLETRMCECCGATGVAMTHLTRIDSGQLLCPRCLAALRAEAARSA